MLCARVRMTRETVVHGAGYDDDDAELDSSFNAVFVSLQTNKTIRFDDDAYLALTVAKRFSVTLALSLSLKQ